VVLYGRETLSLRLKEEHRLKLPENGAENNIWTQERRRERRVEKIA
jgi:hypothetical protein